MQITGITFNVDILGWTSSVARQGTHPDGISLQSYHFRLVNKQTKKQQLGQNNQSNFLIKIGADLVFQA